MDFLIFLEGTRTPFFDTVFSLITQLAEKTVLVVIFCIIFWCINKRMAYIMGLTFFVSALVVQGLKIVFRVPRPWIANPALKPVEGSVTAATGYSFPSGHTQTGAALFGSLGAQLRKKWVKAICFFVAILIGFSRLYLGVHYPSDVIVSLLITFAVVFLASRFITDEPVSIKQELMLALFILASALVVIGTVIYLHHFEISTPSQLRDAVIAAGAMIGFGVGLFVERNYIKFSVRSKNVWMHVLKVILGIAGTLIVQEGFKVFGSGLVMDGIRYFLVVMWIMVFYPLIIKRFFAIKEPPRSLAGAR